MNDTGHGGPRGQTDLRVWLRIINRLQGHCANVHKSIIKAEKERLLNEHYCVMRDKKQKESLRFTDLSAIGSEKTFHTLNCVPSSRRIVVKPSHSFFLSANKGNQ